MHLLAILLFCEIFGVVLHVVFFRGGIRGTKLSSQSSKAKVKASFSSVQFHLEAFFRMKEHLGISLLKYSHTAKSILHLLN